MPSVMTLALPDDLAEHIAAKAGRRHLAPEAWVIGKLRDLIQKAPRPPVVCRGPDETLPAERAARIKEQAAQLANLGRVRVTGPRTHEAQTNA